MEKVERQGHTNRRHSMPDTGKVENATAAFKIIYLIATITYWGRVGAFRKLTRSYSNQLVNHNFYLPRIVLGHN